MRLYAGTSGFAYKEWKGIFYPRDLADDDMLRAYGELLPAVELNNTFYRMPRRNVVDGWYAKAPEGFVFVVKASRRITHIGKLRGVDDAIGFLLAALEGLREKQGPVLFQLPPQLRKDVTLLADFLEKLPPSLRVAVEFRNESWFADDVYDVLRRRDAAFVYTDTEDPRRAPPRVPTATWGYVRLHREEYAEADLDEWVDVVAAQPWTQAFAFFDHGEEGPLLAGTLNQKFVAAGGEPPRPERLASTGDRG